MADPQCPGFSPAPALGTIFIKSKDSVCDLKRFTSWAGSCPAEYCPQKSHLSATRVHSCLRRAEEFEAEAPNAAAPNARPRVVLTHVTPWISAEPNLPGDVRGGGSQSGRFVAGSQLARGAEDLVKGRQWHLPRRENWLLAVLLPSLKRQDGWAGSFCGGDVAGGEQTTCFSSTFHFPQLNNDLPCFPRRGTAFFEMLLPNIYLKCHTHTQSKMHVNRALDMKGCWGPEADGEMTLPGCHASAGVEWSHLLRPRYLDEHLLLQTT